MEKIKIIFYGGVGATTGANIMLIGGTNPTSPRKAGLRGTRILVDCGLLQGRREDEERNFENFKYDPSEVEYLLITHAHMDHIGRVPKLVRDGFKGKIISTKETKELALPMLRDALRVMKHRHPDKSLFEENDIEEALRLWEGKDYGEKIELGDGVEMEMINAGHILGSAIIVVSPPTPLNLRGESEKKIRIAFTGDLGNSPSPILPDTEIPQGVDYMVMESVYGDRNHESKQERREKLKKALLEGIKKEGTIVIPAFSIERTQVLLYEINNMVEDGEIPSVPVFLDSPLAEKVTAIYKKYKNDFNEAVKKEIEAGDDIFNFPSFRVVARAAESDEIANTKGAKIILSGSGMSEGGRVVNHEAHFLPDPKATIILVGYQSVGSLGRAIQEGRKEVKINGEKIKVRAKIENILGYSSHADSEHLLEFVEKVNTPPNPPLGQGRENQHVKRVFVIMGEPKSSLFLSQRIRDYLDIEAVYPEEGKEYELDLTPTK